MAKKKNTLGKLLAFTTTAAAIGGVCYIFRDKIKESSIYKASVNKLTDIYDKFSDNIKADEDDFFFDDEDEDFEKTFSEEPKNEREYTSITINPAEKEIPHEEISPDDQPSDNRDTASSYDKTENDTITDTDGTETASNEDLKEVSPEESIPTITFGSSLNETADSQTPDTASEIPVSETATETVTGYENEGLSDVSEDPDVLEEQDKLDF